MWKLDDAVVYGAAGICKIADIRDEQFGNETKKYYILKPVFDDKNTYFVPSFNMLLMSKIKPVLTSDEIMELIHKMPSIESNWIDNDKQRTESYKEILESGNRDNVVGVLKALYERRAALTEKGKKMRTSDEIIMRNAEMLIENECAYVLGITREGVRELMEKETAI